LSKALLTAAPTATTIILDKEDEDTSLGEIAILCAPREDYVTDSVYLNYLNTLVQNIDTVGAKATPPTDIASALKLLFASSGYSITDKIGVDDASVADRKEKALSACKADLSAYEADYYGTDITVGGREAGRSTANTQPSSGTSVDTFAFLGPIGTAIDTFLSVLQPVLIQASQLVDEQRRLNAIAAALNDPATKQKIQTTGKELAQVVDNFATSSRHNFVGSFVEQLTLIREATVDLNNDSDCKHLMPTDRLASGAPNAAFISCWSVAWTKLKPQVDNLTSIGDNYDTLADANTVSAQSLFDKIMDDFSRIKNGAPSVSFLNDTTQFIAFANAVANAASKSNIAALKSAVTAAEK
jgi:hypothetical protein